MKREIALKRRIKIRLTWSEVNSRISDAHFRMMFRMSRTCFKQLCDKIIISVGERSFMSQAYIDAFLVEKIKLLIHFTAFTKHMKRHLEDLCQVR